MAGPEPEPPEVPLPEPPVVAVASTLLAWVPEGQEVTAATSGSATLCYARALCIELTGAVGRAIGDYGAVVLRAVAAHLSRAIADAEAEVDVAAGTAGQVIRVAPEVRHGDGQHVVDTCLTALRETGWRLRADGHEADGERETDEQQ